MLILLRTYSLKILLYHSIYILSITFDAAKNRYWEAFLIRIITATSWAKKISGRLLKKKKNSFFFVPFFRRVDRFLSYFPWTRFLNHEPTAWKHFENFSMNESSFGLDVSQWKRKYLFPSTFLSLSELSSFAEWNASLVKKKTGEKFHGYLISFNQYLFIE